MTILNQIYEVDFKGFSYRFRPRVRLIQKWLKAGVLEDRQWSETAVGTPQSSVASPLLPNIYLHYDFDLWVEVGCTNAIRFGSVSVTDLFCRADEVFGVVD